MPKLDHLELRSRTPNKDYKIVTPGGGVASQPTRVNLSHWWHLQDCLDSEHVIINFSELNKSLTRDHGQSGDITEGYTVVTLATTTAQTILFTAGDDEERDERAQLGKGAIDVNQAGKETFNVQYGLTLTAGSATNQQVSDGLQTSTFVRCMVSLDPAAPGPIYLYDFSKYGAIAAPIGLQVMPGQTVEVKTSMKLLNAFQIGMYNPNLVDVTVYTSYEGR